MSKKIFKCEHCLFKTTSQSKMNDHTNIYHQDRSFILYFACKYKDRDILIENISAHEIDCTGGQAAFEDGDLTTFGRELVCASRETGKKLYYAVRMHDPGLGLCFDNEWLENGIKYGIFQKYDLPDDVVIN